MGGGFGVRQPQLPLLSPMEEATDSRKDVVRRMTQKAAAAAAALQSFAQKSRHVDPMTREFPSGEKGSPSLVLRPSCKR